MEEKKEKLEHKHSHEHKAEPQKKSNTILIEFRWTTGQKSAVIVDKDKADKYLHDVSDSLSSRLQLSRFSKVDNGSYVYYLQNGQKLFALLRPTQGLHYRIRQFANGKYVQSFESADIREAQHVALMSETETADTTCEMYVVTPDNKLISYQDPMDFEASTQVVNQPTVQPNTTVQLAVGQSTPADSTSISEAKLIGFLFGLFGFTMLPVVGPIIYYFIADDILNNSSQYRWPELYDALEKWSMWSVTIPTLIFVFIATLGAVGGAVFSGGVFIFVILLIICLMLGVVFILPPAIANSALKKKYIRQ